MWIIFFREDCERNIFFFKDLFDLDLSYKLLVEEVVKSLLIKSEVMCLY